MYKLDKTVVTDMGRRGILLHSGALGAKWGMGHAFGLIGRGGVGCNVVMIRCIRAAYSGATIGLRQERCISYLGDDVALQYTHTTSLRSHGPCWGLTTTQ